MKVILPRQVLADPRRLQRVIENTLNQSALAVKADMGVTVQTWDDKPQFKIERRMGERLIYTDDLIYKFVNDGTKAHVIAPKNKRQLSFRTGYNAKTRAGVIGSTGGGASGGWVSTRKPIRHPGTKARNFDKVIKKKWDDKLPTQLQRAIDSEV